MRYRLRTLLIVLAMGPPMIAFAWWVVKSERRRNVAVELVAAVPSVISGLACLLISVFFIAYIAASVAGAITGKW